MNIKFAKTKVWDPLVTAANKPARDRLIIVCLVVLAAAFVLLLHSTFPVEAPEPVQVEAPPVEVVVLPRLELTAKESCKVNSILSESLRACAVHRSCGLSNDEVSMMYVTGKLAIIACKRARLIDLFVKKDFLDKQTEKTEPEDDIRTRKQLDGPYEALSI